MLKPFPTCSNIRLAPLRIEKRFRENFLVVQGYPVGCDYSRGERGLEMGFHGFDSSTKLPPREAASDLADSLADSIPPKQRKQIAQLALIELLSDTCLCHAQTVTKDECWHAQPRHPCTG